MSEEPRSRESLWEPLGVFAVIAALILGNYGLAKVDLGRWGLPAALAIAGVQVVLIAVYYMELREEHGARRFALPAALIFLFLLMSLTIGDVVTRFPPARPTWSEKTLVPEQRPTPRRTTPGVSKPQRYPGQ